MRNNVIYTQTYRSPLGEMTMVSDGEAIMRLDFGVHAMGMSDADLPIFRQTNEWLDRYFRGENPGALPPTRLEGTQFRRAVWRILLTIPYGKVSTYGDIAARIAQQRGLPRMSAQAIGGAVGHNPVSIIVPCHRVIGSNGCLTGYAGGLDKKLALLKTEHIDTSSMFMPKTR